jgi:group I intron endonuclease
MGVYSITCLANGWVYIGSSMSVRQRWTTHRSWLRNGTHKVPQMQADYDEYGAEAFSYDLVSEVADADERYEREQEQITTALATGRCYNLSPSARDNTGHRFTPEQSRKVSAALKGKPKSEEHRANLWRDREVTPEHRENMRLVGSAGAGVPKTAEHRQRIGLAQQGSGNHQAKLTDDRVREIKRRLSIGEKGRALAAEFGVSEPVISNIKHGHRWAHIIT